MNCVITAIDLQRVYIENFAIFQWDWLINSHRDREREQHFSQEIFYVVIRLITFRSSQLEKTLVGGDLWTREKAWWWSVDRFSSSYDKLNVISRFYHEFSKTIAAEKSQKTKLDQKNNTNDFLMNCLLIMSDESF